MNQQALTILHEAWYKLLIEEGAEDSRFARHMNVIFASKEKSKPNLLEYLDLLKLSEKLGFKGKSLKFYIHLLGRDISVSRRYPDKEISPKAVSVIFERERLNLSEDMVLQKNRFNVLKGLEVFIDLSGKIIHVQAGLFMATGDFEFYNLRDLDPNHLNISMGEDGDVYEFTLYGIDVYDDGKLVSGPYFNSRIRGKVKNSRVTYEFD